MRLYAFPSSEACELVVDARSISRYPEFAANLISGFRVLDAKGDACDSVAVWRAVREQKLSPVLDRYVSSAVPAGFSDLVFANILAIKRSLDRSENILTVFFEAQGSLWVSKLTQVAYHAALVSLQGGDFDVAQKEPIYPGMIYEVLILNKAIEKDWLGVFSCLQQFLDVVFARFSSGGETLVGLAIDAIPRNAVIDADGSVSFFDLEFADYGAVSKSFFIYRMCISIMGRKGHLFDGCASRCIYDVYKSLCLHFGLRVNIKREIALENAFQAMVAGSSLSKRVNTSRVLKDFSRGENLVSRVRKLPKVIEVETIWLFYLLCGLVGRGWKRCRYF